MLYAVEDWKTSLDKGLEIDVIYLDLQKAFDKVPHKRLLLKLAKYGLDGGQILAWITNFLTGRKQVIAVEGQISQIEFDVISGVPQGSILGPLLFNLYINDLVDDIDSTILLYADDTKLYRIIMSPEDSAKLQEDLDRISAWMKTWLMEINIPKSHHLTLGAECSSASYSIGPKPCAQYTVERDWVPWLTTS